MADTKVVADLVVNTGSSKKKVKQLSRSVEQLTKNTNSASMAFASMKGMLGAAAIQGAVTRIAGGMARMVKSAAQYHNFMDQTRIGLRTIMGQVEQVNGKALGFAAAGGLARQEFEKIRMMAVATTATTGQMFEAFQGVYGPLRAAGAEMKDIRDVTVNTVHAAGALGVDLKQAGRDIQLMARGTAGMDTKLFVALRSMGAITATTKEFNTALPVERAKMIQEALSGFAEAGDAAAASWGGVTSTFGGVVEELRAMLMSPMFVMLAKNLRKLNDLILKHWDTIKAVLTVFGRMLANVVKRAVDIGVSAYDAILQHWDEITAAIESAVAKLKSMVPFLKLAAGAFLAMKGASLVGGAGALLAKGGGSIMGAVGGAGGAISGAVGGMGTALMGAFHAVLTQGFMGALMSGFGALMTVIGPFLVGLAVIGGLIVFMTYYWDQISAVFARIMPVLAFIAQQFIMIGGYLWDVLRPILKFTGALVFALVGFLGLLVTALVAYVMPSIVRLTAGMAEAFAVIEEGVDQLVKWIFDAFHWLLDQMGLEWTRKPATSGGGLFDGLGKKIDEMVASLKGQKDADTGAPKPDAPKARATTVNDFRGSKITVKQDFRQADPDRIAAQMMGEITKYAAQRIQSGNAPVFGGY